MDNNGPNSLDSMNASKRKKNSVEKNISINGKEIVMCIYGVNILPVVSLWSQVSQGQQSYIISNFISILQFVKYFQI